MIKLQDFATQQGVTDRQVQRLIKKYADELNGLYQRRGPNGTWLTEEACDLLRSKMKQQPIVVGDAQAQADLEAAQKKIAELQEQRADLATRLADLSEWKAAKAAELAEAEQIRLRLASAEQEKVLLEVFVADAKAEIAALSNEKAQAEEKARTASEDAQRAQDALTAAHKRECALKEYTAALEAWSALGWWKQQNKKKYPKPVMPPMDTQA